ncbi:MAG: Ldh family oxidoreductase [Planctomycetota bacterium]|jgi:LDH2 family malate/lactate/ureidoglycolate dehydrogenase|nr:Ldh family oxidoreductase [Planctomycetota bacterium]
MRYSEQTVKEFCAGAMRKVGLSAADAEIVADSLVESEMRGATAHGLARLGIYADRISRGLIFPAAAITLVNAGKADSALLLDGGNGPGVVVAAKAMDTCLERAAKTGVCFAAVRNASHYGAGWHCATRASRRGRIGFSVCNGNHVAPSDLGGSARFVGINPITIAIPAGRHPDLVLDMATSVVSRDGLDPADSAADPGGLEAAEPSDLLAAVMLPLGGAQGFGIALIIDIVCGALSGARDAGQIASFFNCGDPDEFRDIGLFMGVLDIEKLIDIEVFRERVDRILDEFKRRRPTRRATSVIPGEAERRNHQTSRELGLEISRPLLDDLRRLAENYSLPHPFADRE